MATVYHRGTVPGMTTHDDDTPGMDEVIREDALRSLWRETPQELIALLDRGKGVVLSYLGHADTTRLIAETDPLWQWEPRGGWDEYGEPRFIRDDAGYPVRLWIDLTILGVTRPGVGTVAKGKADPEKELIGDAIRNAAMRFGIGADLWSKAQGAGGLDDNAPTPRREQGTSGPAVSDEKRARAAELRAAAKALGLTKDQYAEFGQTQGLHAITSDKLTDDMADAWIGWLSACIDAAYPYTAAMLDPKEQADLVAEVLALDGDERVRVLSELADAGVGFPPPEGEQWSTQRAEFVRSIVSPPF